MKFNWEALLVQIAVIAAKSFISSLESQNVTQGANPEAKIDWGNTLANAGLGALTGLTSHLGVHLDHLNQTAKLAQTTAAVAAVATK